MNFQRAQFLPLSQQKQQQQQQEQGPGIRRRLSSLSLKRYSSPATEWALRRSKSMSESAGVSIAKWWGWGWDWILSRKPAFALDLEMSSEETALLGSQNKGSWRHVLYKLSSEIKRLVASTDKPKFGPATYFNNNRNTLPH